MTQHLDEVRRVGRSQQNLRARSLEVRRLEDVTRLSEMVPKALRLEAPLDRGGFEILFEVGRGLLARGVSPTEDCVRMIGDECAVRRMKCDELFLRWQKAFGVAARNSDVVVVYLFLFDGDRRDVFQRLITVIGRPEVRKECRDRVTVMHDLDFEGLHKLVRFAGSLSGVVDADERVQPRRRDRRIGFAELEGSPQFPVARPAFRRPCEADQILPADLACRRAKGIAHLLRHRDVQRRLHEARRDAQQDVVALLIVALLFQEDQPGGRRG